MPKGLRTMFPAAIVLAVALSIPLQLPAQVYRCEGASGVIFSDMPCDASAEQIDVTGDVMDSRGLGASTPANGTDAVTTGEGAGPVPGQGAEAFARQLLDASGTEESAPDLNDFLAMLRTQREQQMGEIDSQLARLRQQAGSPGFLDMEESEQDQLNRQITQLESHRASILSEYEALIAEAERRLD